MLGGVIRTLTVGPRLIQAVLLLPELLRRLDEIERHAHAMVGNTSSMERSTATLVVEVAEMDRTSGLSPRRPNRSAAWRAGCPASGAARRCPSVS